MDSLEQAREALTKAKKVLGQIPGDVDSFAAFDAVEGALAALSRPVEGVEGEPRVKPLAWSDFGSDVTTAMVWRDLRFGYGVVLYYGGSHEPYSVRINGREFTRAESLDAAKARAQADYERRILSALAAPPVADSEALRERVAELEATRDRCLERLIATARKLDAAEARLAQAERGPVVTEDMVERAAKSIVETDCASEGLTFTELSRAMARSALEAALHPQSAAGEEGKP